jgi:hypothetical protein
MRGTRGAKRSRGFHDPRRGRGGRDGGETRTPQPRNQLRRGAQASRGMTKRALWQCSRSVIPDFGRVAPAGAPRGDGVPALVRVALYVNRLVHLRAHTPRRQSRHIRAAGRQGGASRVLSPGNPISSFTRGGGRHTTRGDENEWGGGAGWLTSSLRSLSSRRFKAWMSCAASSAIAPVNALAPRPGTQPPRAWTRSNEWGRKIRKQTVTQAPRFYFRAPVPPLPAGDQPVTPEGESKRRSRRRGFPAAHPASVASAGALCPATPDLPRARPVECT